MATHLANQTNFSLTLTSVQTTNIGFYALVATNIFGSATSPNTALNVNGFNSSNGQDLWRIIRSMVVSRMMPAVMETMDEHRRCQLTSRGSEYQWCHVVRWNW